MKKILVTALLSMSSSWALAAETPLTLDTAVVGDVTVSEVMLLGTVFVAGAAAMSSSGGSSNGGSPGTTGTTGTTGTSN